MVLKRKKMVMGVLVLLLILTGYFNHLYNQNALEAKNIVKDNDDGKPDNNISITDVDNDMEVSTKSFFKDFRYDRENNRKKEVEYIQNLINNPNSENEQKVAAQEKLLSITDIMEKELGVEGLIKAKGFNDAVVIMQESSVNVVVDKRELTQEEVAQILDIIRRETGQPADNIKIIPKS